jgi:hypothetical protein
VDKVPVGSNLYKEGGNSQEYQASDEQDKAPQKRAGPFPFETPSIPKSGGLRADPSPSYKPISTRKAPLHHNIDRVLSASKPQAMLHLFAGRTAHLRTITPTPHEQNQVSWAAMGAEGRDTLQSSVVLEGTPTGTPIMRR